MTAFSGNVVAIAEQELLRWKDSSGADEEPFRAYVAEYWQLGLGISRRDGATVYVDPSGRRFRPAWSAAFVSYVYRLAGAKDHFFYSEAHIHYVIQALRDAESAAPQARFLARDPAQYCPKPGDLINELRGGGALSLAQLSACYGPNPPPTGKFIPTHSDIIVEVDQASSIVRSIGGNLGNGVVRERRWQLSSCGRVLSGDQLLCVLECTL